MMLIAEHIFKPKKEIEPARILDINKYKERTEYHGKVLICGSRHFNN